MNFPHFGVKKQVNHLRILRSDYMDPFTDLQSYATNERAIVSARFFKTGKGEYSEGDLFIGVTVPQIRIVAKKHMQLELDRISSLLANKIHESRLLALLILVEKFKKADEGEQKAIAEFYLANTSYINNWDLVDSSADKILGAYLFDKDKSLLYELAKSPKLWERRIAIIATFYFIKNNQFEETCKIAEMLVDDTHDLIHKAVGWMLREMGKKDQEREEKFLLKHYKKMPRTMLRYAIEKFSEEKKKFYMNR